MSHQEEPPKVDVAAMAAVIRATWKSGYITQESVARDLGIHQSQFSKIVNGQFKQPRGNAVRLFEYSKGHAARQRRHGSEDVESMRQSLIHQLMRAWDETEDGARALEAILEGARLLSKARTL